MIRRLTCACSVGFLPFFRVRNAMQRVMVIGQPGSGKTTFARHLGAITGLPVVHIDRIHYRAGWEERTQAEKTALCEGVHARDRWIFEGGHARTWPERLDRADTVIWLDLPLPLRFWRLIRRTVRHYGRARPEMPAGCRERFDLAFFAFVWRTRDSGWQQARRLLDSAPEGKRIHHLTTANQAEAYLAKAANDASMA